MAEAARRQAAFYGPLDLLALHKEVRPIALVFFDNKECIELKLVSPGGDLSFLYVDAETYLIAGTKATLQTPVGAVESKTYLRDYQDLNGQKTPTQIFTESNVQRLLIKIETVNFDPIAQEEYAPPKRTP